MISITDGQIFLETDLFNAGIRPAVNPGISVSRVGSAAQIPAMKKVSGSLKLTYSQYRELQAFAQFGSDLDKDTKERLAKGERVVEVLKQDKNAPLSAPRQVAVIYAVVNDLLRNVPVNRVAEWEQAFLTELDECHSHITDSIRETGKLLPETESALRTVIEEFTGSFV